MNRTLMTVVADVVVLFATCDEDQVDPDLAVRKLEEIGAQLKNLPSESQAEFTAHCKELADSAPEGDADLVTAYRELPEQLGLEG